MPIYAMHLCPAETIVCIGSAWEDISVIGKRAEPSIDEQASQMVPRTFFPDLSI
jgi:hypothetical protein